MKWAQRQNHDGAIQRPFNSYGHGNKTRQRQIPKLLIPVYLRNAQRNNHDMMVRCGISSDGCRGLQSQPHLFLAPAAVVPACAGGSFHMWSLSRHVYRGSKNCRENGKRRVIGARGVASGPLLTPLRFCRWTFPDFFLWIHFVPPTPKKSYHYIIMIS